jgi:hypothetical protein
MNSDFGNNDDYSDNNDNNMNRFRTSDSYDNNMSPGAGAAMTGGDRESQPFWCSVLHDWPIGELVGWDRNANDELDRNSNTDFNNGSGGDFSTGIDNYQSNTGGFDTGSGAGAAHSSYDRDNEANFGNERTRDFNKPSIGDKLTGLRWSLVTTPMFLLPRLIGSAEKMAGKLMNNEGMVERGQERKASVKDYNAVVY